MRPCNTDHAAARIAQRYGLSREDLLLIAQDIDLQHPNVRYICAETLTKSIYRVLYRSRWVHVVYDRSAKAVITVLPGFLKPSYVRKCDGESRITSKQEVDFTIPKEWEDV